MNRWLVRSVAAGLLGLAGLVLSVGQAAAHVNYGASLYSDSSIIDPVTGVNGTGIVNATPGRTVSSNAGWLAGQDNTTWANSHDQRFLYFDLAQTMTVDFTITGTANTNGADVLNPAYSLFSGWSPSQAHDGAVIPAINATQTGFASWSPFASTNTAITGAGGTITTAHWGTYRSNGDFTMGADTGAQAGQYSTLHYLFSGSNLSGNTITGHYTLGPGVYSLIVGGANVHDFFSLLTDAIASNACATAGPACTNYTNDRLARNFTINFAVSAVPVPAAVILFGTGLTGIIAFARRRVTA